MKKTIGDILTTPLEEQLEEFHKCPNCNSDMEFRNFWRTSLFGITFWHWFCKKCNKMVPCKEKQ